jgi:predicted nuclease of predicted toxin-antitoxin system
VAVLGPICVKLFIDECLSPQLATRLNATGRYDAVHPLHVGRRGEPDHRIVEWCIAEDRIIVTENARDFRRLIGRSELHPGLIILPALIAKEHGRRFRRHSLFSKAPVSLWI